MKQTIKLRPENYSRTIREEVVPSADLRGHVHVEVKNTKTGEIEQQENHNLIVYGGREWLAKRIFGKMLPNNDFACNSAITWVGFGCGGGEPGNPLQCGTTMGQDKDLYQPVRVRFDDDANTASQDKNYASRILPNGSIVPGYFKKISNITLKEDHANPYIQDGVTKYPKLIAEMRIELSSDDCNGVNYTDNGNLVAYQDINEVALFAANQDEDDPGANDEYDTIYLNMASSDEKIFDEGTIFGDGEGEVILVNKIRRFTSLIPANAYRFQIQITSGSETKWVDVDPNKAVIFHISPDMFWVKDDGSKILYSTDGGISWKDNVNGHWQYTLPAGVSIENNSVRLVPNGVYQLHAINKMPPTTTGTVKYEIQYRNYYNEPWKTVTNGTFDSTGKTSNLYVYCSCYEPQTPSADTFVLEEGSYATMFRCVETTNTSSEFQIAAMETDDTSYDVKCYVSQSDIKKIKVGHFVYTPASSEFGINNIPQSAPLSVIEVYDPEVEDPTTASQHQPYFVIERQGTEDHTYTPTKRAITYTPSTKKPYEMFSRVTLSSIRKNVDREIVIIYKIYV